MSIPARFRATAPRHERSLRDDGGQLLLLAGIVLVMAFVVTAFTLSQVSEVEKQAAKEQEEAFLTEYRFLHAKLPSILSGNTGKTTDNVSFNATFATTVTSFRATLATKGYDAAIYLAGNASSAPKSECMFLAAPCSKAAPPPGGHLWGGVLPTGGTTALNQTYDGTSDGIAWMCDQQRGAAVAAVVHVYLSDGRSSISETVVVPLNAEWFKAEVKKANDPPVAGGLRCK